MKQIEKPKIILIQHGTKLLVALKELLKMYFVSHGVVLHHVRTHYDILKR